MKRSTPIAQFLFVLQLAWGSSVCSAKDVQELKIPKGVIIGRVVNANILPSNKKDGSFDASLTVHSEALPINFSVKGVPPSIPLYMLEKQKDAPVPVKLDVPVKEYLRVDSGAVLVYDSNKSIVCIAVPNGGRIDILAFKSVQEGQYILRLFANNGVEAISVGKNIWAIARQILNKFPPYIPGSQASVFLKALNHPSAYEDIKKLTTPHWAHPVTHGVVPELKEGTLYRGVLDGIDYKQVEKTVTITTWTGRETLRLQPNGQTKLFMLDSPKSPLPRFRTPVDGYVDANTARSIEPGQFVTIYASAATRLVEWIAIYRRSDP